MLRTSSILLLLALVGCAARRGDAPVAQSPAQDDSAAAMALAFDPPSTIGQIAPELSREPREPGAFVAYDEGFTSFTYIRYDDRQVARRGGRFERQAIIERFGTSRR